MAQRSRLAILPVEIRHRELDAMLLLGAVLAERGWSVLLGNRTSLIRRQDAFPPAVLLGKTVQVLDAEVYGRWRGAGHRIAALDEEGLITFSRELYLRRRVHPPTMAATDLLLGWGDEHAAIWQDVAAAHPGITAPVKVVGNARFDLLRPELRAFHTPEVQAIRGRHGRFILFNSNFGTVNAFTPEQNRFPHPDELARTGAEPPRGYDADLARYRHVLFAAYREAIPAIARRFPELKLIVRPHPAEAHDVWQAVLADCPNGEVVYEGSSLPWILAAEDVVHHSCTTAVEACLLGRPSLSFRPVEIDRFDPFLTGVTSERVRSLPDLLRRLEERLAGGTRAPDPEATGALRARVAGMDGPLAAERIANALETLEPSPPLRLRQRLTRLRWRVRERQRGRTGGRITSAWTDHLYPPDEPGGCVVRERFARLRSELGRFEEIQISGADLSFEAPQLYRLQRQA